MHDHPITFLAGPNGRFQRRLDGTTVQLLSSSHRPRCNAPVLVQLRDASRMFGAVDIKSVTGLNMLEPC